ncbi:MAG: putative addiction module component (TIGR02574 family) [Rhodothermales bacterium]|jgi:putative addiction module component (TIGR02574 family)
MDLPSSERAVLAHQILLSLDDDDTDADAAWDQEIARRVAEIDAGTGVGRPVDDVFREIRARYG